MAIGSAPDKRIEDDVERRATTIDRRGVTFRYHDGSEEVSAVSLVQEVAIPRSGPDFLPVGHGDWRVRFARPDVDRFEYRFELRWPGGDRELILDPDNDKHAPGAFGARSVIEFPGYVQPDWLGSDAPAGDARELTLPSSLLGADQPAILWAAHGSPDTAALPLLVALDGIEFARFSDLLRFLDAGVAGGALPPMRALLLHPTRRDDHYSANPIFPAALSEEMIPALERIVPIAPGRRNRAALGASLGGLALLHAQRTIPDLFGAVFLQSSTFLHHGYLLGFTHFRRVERFLDDVLGDELRDDPELVELTCGTVELSLDNNIAVAESLRRQGHRVGMHVLRDAHNWIAWRDAWAPNLANLLGESYG